MKKAPSDIKPLINYFLHLFKIQVVGEGQNAEASQAVVVEEKSGGDTIYSLTIKTGGQWKSRRMSIRQLGEQVESKSTCYKITYDDLIVVKIPPKPVTDFQRYLNAIFQEHRIAGRLMPAVACVYPNLGAILKKIPGLKCPADMSTEAAEAEYIDRLTREPHLQRHLQIDEGFVFFMSLSRYPFFNQVIDGIHSATGRIQEEIIKNGPETISDIDAFETLYGPDHDNVYFEMQGLVRQYAKSVDEIIQQSGTHTTIADYQQNDLLFSRIAGRRPETRAEELPAGLYEQIDSMTEKLLENKKPVIEKYRQTVHATVKRKTFDSNRGRIKGLIVNVIELLYRLQNRSVAVRDLKPDNMYIGAALDGADHILADFEAYDLGLIDLETAACFEGETADQMAQPLLAGTPAYATPSHIFSNKILHALYKTDLPVIFHMQDWYAAIVMIYYVVCGRLPFYKTAKLLPEISRLKKKNAARASTQLEIYKTSSQRFWQTATQELEEKLEKNRKRLQNIEVDLPRHLVGCLEQLAARERERIDKMVAVCIKSRSSVEKYRERLQQASHAAVEKNLQQITATKKARGDLAHVLFRIEPLKRQQKRLSSLSRQLREPVACDALLSFLFDRVFYAMHRPYWADLKSQLTGHDLQNR
ncbi:MAG: hypothetical protein ACQERN_09075 [Thermodesulfobacteriota bacterium]